jgi:ADP-dependent phosphofructokinase/glucokinase
MAISVLQLVVYLVLRRNDIGEIREEVRQFFNQILQTVSQALWNGYTLLRRDEEEKDDD